MVDRIVSAIASGAPIVNVHGRDIGGFALRWAQEHPGAFPGGYLAVNLEKYRMPGGINVRAVLGRFLAEINTTAHRPETLSERHAHYRACMEQRERTLIALDNADAAAQVRAFRCPNSLILVTSVRLLGGLIPDGACFIRMSGGERQDK